MARVNFEGEKEIEVAENKSILECSLQSGIPHTHMSAAGMPDAQRAGSLFSRV